LDLRGAQRRLHIGGFQVISNVRVNVFVIVAAGQTPKLPAEAFAASVFLAGIAPAVATPVAKGLDENLEVRFIGEYGSSLAHGDVMGGIETHSGDVAKRANAAAFPRGTEGVTAVFDEPEIMFVGETADGIEVKNVAKRVGDHNGPGALAARS